MPRRNLLSFLLLFFSLLFFPLCHASPASDQFFVIIFVEAQHLNYSGCKDFLKSLEKNREFGHAWMYLEGVVQGKRVCFEGGHSGELGVFQAKYLDGIMNFIDYGNPNPTVEDIKHPKFEPNPIKYLWVSQKDGFFQKGSGGHAPTYAAKFILTEEQFFKVLDCMNSYDFSTYALTGNQCTSFIEQIAGCFDFPLNTKVTMKIDRVIFAGGRWLILWRDPFYSSITFSCPDKLEQSLIQAVKEGKAEFYPTENSPLKRS